jgi:soluble lytic murein transglycosylase
VRADLPRAGGRNARSTTSSPPATCTWRTWKPFARRIRTTSRSPRKSTCRSARCADARADCGPVRVRSRRFDVGRVHGPRYSRPMLRNMLPLLAAIASVLRTLEAQQSPSKRHRRRADPASPLSRRAAAQSTRAATELRAALEAADRGTCRARRPRRSPSHPAAGWVEYANAQARHRHDAARARPGVPREITKARPSPCLARNLARLALAQARIGRRSAPRGRTTSTDPGCAAPNSTRARRPATPMRNGSRCAGGVAQHGQGVASPRAMRRSRSSPPRRAARMRCVGSASTRPRRNGIRRRCAAAARGLPSDRTSARRGLRAFFDAVQRPRADVAEDAAQPDDGLAGPRASGEVGADAGRHATAEVREALRLHRSRPRPRAVPGRAVDGGLVRTRFRAAPHARARLAYDDRLHEWRVREAMSRSDWPAALAADPEDGRQAARAIRAGRISQARLDGNRRRQGGAPALVSAGPRASRNSTGSSPPIASTSRMRCARSTCSSDTPARSDSRARSGASCARWRCTRSIARAGRNASGTMRCRASRRAAGVAVAVAQQERMVRPRVFALGKQPEEQTRMYALRFPLHHDATIRREAAKNGLDPAWVARRDPRAKACSIRTQRSGANAMGLMQVVPRRAGAAQRIGVPWNGVATLYDPDANIAIGRRTCASSTTVRARPTWCSPATTRARAARTLAGAAPGHGPGLLDRDHQLQGNARLRRARAGLQRDLRLAPQRRRGTGVRSACAGSGRQRKPSSAPTPGEAAPRAPAEIAIAGWHTYLVGGAVRDRSARLPPGDRDFVVVGETPERCIAQGFKAVGATSRCSCIRRRARSTRSRARSANRGAASRLRRRRASGRDARRRPAAPRLHDQRDRAEADDGTLVDPWGGARDLEARVLRHVGPAFVEDPLRVLRAARFMARFAPLGFTSRRKRWR